MITTSTQKCSWSVERGWTTLEHLRDCDDHECGGCKPCPKTHCAMRGRCPNHVQPHAGEMTCPRCIHRVRSDLGTIITRYAELSRQAEIHGVNSEAFNLNGPAASPEQVDARKRAGLTVESDPHHPYAVLARWEFMLRTDYNHYTDLFATISSSSEYLLRNLDRLAQDDTHDFEMFASDIRTCLTHLEAVLDDSRRPELGAPCPKCEAEGVERPRRLGKKWGRTEIDDRWACSECGLSLTEAEYRLRVGTSYRRNAPSLTATDMHAEHGIKAGTVRTWAARGLVRKRGKNSDGQQLYDVADTLRISQGDVA